MHFSPIFVSIIKWCSRFLTKWKYWGFHRQSRANPHKLRLLIELEFKNAAFHKQRNINEMNKLEKRTNNKLKPLMRQSLWCYPRQVGVKIRKVGEYKTRFKGCHINWNVRMLLNSPSASVRRSVIEIYDKKKEG